ncbi:tetratricopeptide repeat protein [Sphingomonas colocasiae]|uniref:Tetratricopeptide repeat protein n=1 Tax=Sphingomonas colocasiae TaxID=1848973 RepID=A0ABS7PY88_9SPHN|nr:tetratricopeptide repeat protein [Sphingomonas colocasiae]MBY8826325.1 tetratricopeptide repeat protein [Sphingomonas colocasiae]
MMKSNDEIGTSEYKKINELCARGDALAESGNFDEAVYEYNKALYLIPDPKNHWKASTWIFVAIADACFLGGYMVSAREALEYAMTCQDAIGNAFVHLRYGQVLFDIGDKDLSASELMRAYMAGGVEIFTSEDPRYLEFLRARANL